jgi:hypothetical protein
MGPININKTVGYLMGAYLQDPRLINIGWYIILYHPMVMSLIVDQRKDCPTIGSTLIYKIQKKRYK